MYVFDSSSLIVIFNYYYPKRFPKFWHSFDGLLDQQKIISVSEVYEEIETRNTNIKLLEWKEKHKSIFFEPTDEEAIFLKDQFFKAKNGHFQQSLSLKKQYKGGPFADPFLIAKAKKLEGTIVTQEKYSKDGVTIPSICEYFSIRCADLETFMEKEEWVF